MTAHTIYVVSGGAGTSGEQLVRTVMAQFGDAEVPVVVVPHVREVEELRRVTADAAVSGSLIVHTLVDVRLRHALEKLAREAGAHAIDVLGPLLEHVARVSGREPLGSPGLYRRLHKDYFTRIEAIEYAVAHDDGRNPGEILGADIVLIGVSRVGKTPLSMYLAMLGWKTANIPLVKGIPAPRQLFDVDRRRVVGLIAEPDHLLSHRRRRQRDLGVAESVDYTDPRQIAGEVEHALAVFRRGRFTVLNITDKPIEETAAEVLAALAEIGQVSPG